MDKFQIDQIFNNFKSHDPIPKTELNYTNEFTLLIAVMLSAQTTDKAVNKATSELFQNFDTPEKILSLGSESLKKYIRGLGLYNTKAQNIINMSNILIEKYNSKVPGSFEELITLPGVGLKTANVVLNCAYNSKVVAVDTHVFRVAKRLGLAYGKTPLAVAKELEAILPDKWKIHAHHWLVLHGRYICKAKKPICSNCHIKKFCYAFNNFRETLNYR